MRLAMVASRYEPPDSPAPRKSKRASAKPASGIIRPRSKYLSPSFDAPRPWHATTHGAGREGGRCRTPAMARPPTRTEKRSLGPDEVEEPADIHGQPVHRLVDCEALDLGHLLRHARGHPRSGRLELELASVPPRAVALDEQRVERHRLHQLAVPLAVHHLGRDGD